MIHPHTRKALGLAPITRDHCYSFYVQINSEPHAVEDIKDSISLWQNNPEELNRLWWVLNYYSERLDPGRYLRARVENTLDTLAQEKLDRESPPA